MNLTPYTKGKNSDMHREKQYRSQNMQNIKDNIEFVQAQVALTVCDNKNTREKLFKANAAM